MLHSLDLQPQSRDRCPNNKDEEKTVQIYQRYTFALIIENCDAEGYVSEKFYDAICAGCVPLYWGNPSSRVKLPQDMYIDIRGFPGQQLSGYSHTCSHSKKR